MRNVSGPAALPFFRSPSVAVRRKPYVAVLFPTVPVPLYCAFAPEITSQSYEVLTNWKPAALNWNRVLPAGLLCPFWYFETNPNVALPLRSGFATYAPAGETIHPPPVTKPDDGS